MNSVTVTIGRNVPTPRTFTQDINDMTYTNVGPDLQETLVLTDVCWIMFTGLIIEELEHFAKGVKSAEWWIETHDGLGEWDGVQEQSRKLTLLFDAAPFEELNRIQLEIALVSVRSLYHQDAIAVSYGDSRLI